MDKLTLEELLARTSDKDLLNIQNELTTCVVPSSGYAHTFCRKVNRMIGAGELCINQNSYRKVYLPTLEKSVRRELARRYTEAIRLGMVRADEVTISRKRQPSQTVGQITLDMEGLA